MKLGVYTAILHDKPLREALEVIASLGLTGAEINAGGFLPHAPPVLELLSGEVTSQQYLSTFDGTGVSIAGLNCNGNPLHPDPRRVPRTPTICATRSGSPDFWVWTASSRCPGFRRRIPTASGRPACQYLGLGLPGLA